jgi:hypothetical protein
MEVLICLYLRDSTTGAGILRDGKMLQTGTHNGSGMNPRVTPVM